MIKEIHLTTITKCLNLTEPISKCGYLNWILYTVQDYPS